MYSTMKRFRKQAKGKGSKKQILRKYDSTKESAFERYSTIGKHSTLKHVSTANNLSRAFSISQAIEEVSHSDSKEGNDPPI